MQWTSATFDSTKRWHDSHPSSVRSSCSAGTTISATITSPASWTAHRRRPVSGRTARYTNYGRLTVNWNSAPITCEQARASIADSLIDRGSSGDASALDAHLAGCVDCRRYRDDCHALWSALENIPVAAPASDARRIFANRLASETHGKRPPRDSKV